MTTITVAKDGTGDYTSIQVGINVANPGDIIQVKDGLYPEKVTINEQTKLYAQSRNTIIDGTNIPYPGSFWEKGLVEIIADNVIFSGFKVQNSKSSGIVSINANNLIIEKNLTYKTWSSGIQIHDGTNLKVLFNEIDKAANPDIYRGNPQENLSIASPRNNMNGFEVAYNYIHGGNKADDGTYILYNGGIYVKQGCKNGSVHHNYITDIYYGTGTIYLDGWDLITQNIDIYKNLLDGVAGLACTTEAGGQTNDLTFRDNIVTRCTRGFATPNTSRTGIINNLTINNNIFYKNGAPPGQCVTYQWKGPGLWLGRSGFQYLPTYSGVMIRDNIICNNCSGQIIIDPRIPTSAYNSDIFTSNHTTLDYISQTEFDTKYNVLYNEITGEVIDSCTTPVLSMIIG